MLRRKYRRYGAGQRSKKCFEVRDLLLIELDLQLHAPHDLYGVTQLPNRTVVKIGRGLGDVAQPGNLEDVAIAFDLGALEATLVDRVRAGRRPVGLVHPEPRVSTPADVGSVVALRTPDLDERRKAVLLAHRQRVGVSLEIRVEA